MSNNNDLLGLTYLLTSQKTVRRRLDGRARKSGRAARMMRGVAGSKVRVRLRVVYTDLRPNLLRYSAVRQADGERQHFLQHVGRVDMAGRPAGSGAARTARHFVDILCHFQTLEPRLRHSSDSPRSSSTAAVSYTHLTLPTILRV